MTLPAVNHQPVDLCRMQIAGVTLDIISSDYRLGDIPDAVYQRFRHNIESDTRMTVELIVPQNMPSCAGWETIFSSDGSWSMFTKDGRYCAVLQPSGFSEPVWAARFDHKADEVLVYCSRQMLRIEKGETILHNPVCYPLDQILLMYFLGRQGGVLLHAAGVTFGQGGAFLFPGKSGTGKSTIMKQIESRQPQTGLSDDRVIVRKRQKDFYVYGTPWPGEAGIADNGGCPATAILFLNQAPKCRIRRLTLPGSLRRLLPVVSIPWFDPEAGFTIMDLCGELVASVPCYELSFTPGPEVHEALTDFRRRING